MGTIVGPVKGEYHEFRPQVTWNLGFEVQDKRCTAKKGICTTSFGVVLSFSGYRLLWVWTTFLGTWPPWGSTADQYIMAMTDVRCHGFMFMLARWHAA